MATQLSSTMEKVTAQLSCNGKCVRTNSTSKMHVYDIITAEERESLENNFVWSSFLEQNEQMIRYIDSFMHPLGVRQSYVERMGWVKLDRNNIELIVKIVSKVFQELYQKHGIEDLDILEIGAGLGYLANAIKLANSTRSIPFWPCKDRFTYVTTNFGIRGWKTGSNIENIDALEAVKKYSANCLICSWPEQGQNWSTLALVGFRERAAIESKVIYFIYIGETRGFSCGSECLFEELEENWVLKFSDITWGKLHSWPTIHDEIQVYKFDGRKPTTTTHNSMEIMRC